jgi:ABC-type sugar transport system substrate-binding protein
MRRLAIGLLALAFAGCGIGKGAPDIGTGAADDGKTKVCMMPKLVGIPYFNATERGAKDAASELGVELDYNGPTDATAVHQVEFIQQWVQLRCDAITVAANDPDALAPALKEARRAGVKTGSWDADVQKGARGYFVNQATFKAVGRTVTDIMARQTGKKGKFLIVTGSLTAPNQNEWIAEMKKRMKQRYPKMKVVSVQPGEENLQKGIDVTKSYLSANPDTTGVFGITTVAMPGVAEAVRQLGLTGKVKVTGITDPVIAKPYIDAGVVKQAMLWNPEDLGYLAVYVAKKMIDGTMPKSGSFKAGRLGRVKIPKKGEVLLGKPLVYGKKNVGKFKF